MPQIGSFTRDETGFSGRVHTLTLFRELTILPAEHSTPKMRQTTVSITVLMTAPRSALHGNAPAKRLANISRCCSMIPPCRSRSEPISSATTMQARHGRCTGAACGPAKIGTEIMRSRALLLFTALLTAGSGLTPAIAQVTPQPAPVTAHPHAAFIAEASQRFGIPEHWIRAVLRVESAGDVRAISSAGAMGLMQVMPDTWAGLHSRHGLGRDPYDPRDNILAGTAYLREMWDRYGNVAAMLAAYNAGPGRYDEHLATGRTLPAETRAYVAVLAPVLGLATAPDVPTIVPPPPPDWREAPLFVAQSSGNSAVANQPSNDDRATVPVRVSVDQEPQDGGIFVALASDGDVP